MQSTEKQTKHQMDCEHERTLHADCNSDQIIIRICEYIFSQLGSRLIAKTICELGSEVASIKGGTY